VGPGRRQAGGRKLARRRRSSSSSWELGGATAVGGNLAAAESPLGSPLPCRQCRRMKNNWAGGGGRGGGGGGSGAAAATAAAGGAYGRGPSSCCRVGLEGQQRARVRQQLQFGVHPEQRALRGRQVHLGGARPPVAVAGAVLLQHSVGGAEGVEPALVAAAAGLGLEHCTGGILVGVVGGGGVRTGGCCSASAALRWLRQQWCVAYPWTVCGGHNMHDGAGQTRGIQAW
jgi:hypothetical protein